MKAQGFRVWLQLRWPQSPTPHVRAHPSSDPSTRAACLLHGTSCAHTAGHCCSPPIALPPLPLLILLLPFPSPYASCCTGYHQQQFA